MHKVSSNPQAQQALLSVAYGGRLAERALPKNRMPEDSTFPDAALRFVHDELERSASATLAAAGQQTDQAVALLAKALQDTRAEDNRAIYAALNKLESQSFEQFVSLKKDLDTVAVNADNGLKDTAEGLVELAGYSRPREPK